MGKTCGVMRIRKKLVVSKEQSQRAKLLVSIMRKEICGKFLNCKIATNFLRITVTQCYAWRDCTLQTMNFSHMRIT